MKKRDNLKSYLDNLYKTYHIDYLSTDPLCMVRRFKNSEDQEIAGLIASSLAYGQVKQILKAIEAVLKIMDYKPYNFILSFDPVREEKTLSAFRHRFTTGDDVLCLFYIIKKMIEKEGSIESFYAKGYKEEDRNVRPSLESFAKRALSIDYPNKGISNGVNYLLPSPEKGSPCKRLNLYLRWMVRSDGLDLGIWKIMPPSKLIMPLDTHIARLSYYIGLTARKSYDWKMAEEITESLKVLDPSDPLKYDFSLCRLGILEKCKKGETNNCILCPIEDICLGD